eukprot:m.172507 g.172507  ORF g.172507 m.172507 type:complete len:54 (+) comp39084_c0_seq55:5248-5409(+)
MPSSLGKQSLHLFYVYLLDFRELASAMTSWIPNPGFVVMFRADTSVFGIWDDN